MDGYNFTERLRRVLAMASAESRRLHHEYVGTEHLLLGLMRDDEGVAAAALGNLHVDLSEIRRVIDTTVLPGRASPEGDLPYTSRAKKVLELSMAEALDLHHWLQPRIFIVCFSRTRTFASSIHEFLRARQHHSTHIDGQPRTTSRAGVIS